jgi:DNA-binding FrmR family transcriptional regulator
MILQNQESKENLLQRLRRIEGQARGIQGMLQDERDCREIAQQLTALHSAVQSVSRMFLQEYATACLLELENESASSSETRSRREKIIQDMIALMDKAP